MKRTTPTMPTPWDIDQNPQLALLYLLGESLEVAGRTMVTAHPELLNEDQPPAEQLPADTRAAKLLLASLDNLALRIRCYKKSIQGPGLQKPNHKQAMDNTNF